jgi:hypothetical protein
MGFAQPAQVHILSWDFCSVVRQKFIPVSECTVQKFQAKSLPMFTVKTRDPLWPTMNREPPYIEQNL